MGWLQDLDGILRGRGTSEDALLHGPGRLPLHSCLIAISVLSLVHGALVGLFGVVSRQPPAWEQMLASAAKMPLVFFLTLIVTFPSLYVFSALLDARLNLSGALRVVLASLAIMAAVVSSLSPVSAFFAFTTSSYPFMKLLNTAIFGVGGLIGLGFLVKTIGRLEAGETAGGGQPPTAALSAGQPAPLAERGLGRPSPADMWKRTGAWRIFRVWVVLFAVVGAQMSWILRPFIGHPRQPFAWFRPRGSSFFLDLWQTLIGLLS